MGLTKKNKLFIDYYTDTTCKETHGNATKSAIKAGYSELAAAEIGYKLLKKNHIRSEIAQKEKELGKRQEISRERIIAELQELLNQSISAKEKLQVIDRINQVCGFNITKIESKNENTNINTNLLLQQAAEVMRKQLQDGFAAKKEEELALN